jgi:hypothetical protein
MLKGDAILILMVIASTVGKARERRGPTNANPVGSFVYALTRQIRTSTS